ncbi:hypothetical protein PFISCL1PPCAC_3656, partial [Pristionchus fissidentatus]
QKTHRSIEPVKEKSVVEDSEDSADEEKEEITDEKKAKASAAGSTPAKKDTKTTAGKKKTHRSIEPVKEKSVVEDSEDSADEEKEEITDEKKAKASAAGSTPAKKDTKTTAEKEKTCRSIEQDAVDEVAGSTKKIKCKDVDCKKSVSNNAPSEMISHALDNHCNVKKGEGKMNAASRYAAVEECFGERIKIYARAKGKSGEIEDVVQLAKNAINEIQTVQCVCGMEVNRCLLLVHVRMHHNKDMVVECACGSFFLEERFKEHVKKEKKNGGEKAKGLHRD